MTTCKYILCHKLKNKRINIFLSFNSIYKLNGCKCETLCRYEVPFSTLDPDEMQVAAMNFGKQFNQLDKAIPPNKIVPRCKASVEVIKEKVH